MGGWSQAFPQWSQQRVPEIAGLLTQAAAQWTTGSVGLLHWAGGHGPVGSTGLKWEVLQRSLQSVARQNVPALCIPGSRTNHNAPASRRMPKVT